MFKRYLQSVAQRLEIEEALKRNVTEIARVEEVQCQIAKRITAVRMELDGDKKLAAAFREVKMIMPPRQSYGE